MRRLNVIKVIPVSLVPNRKQEVDKQEMGREAAYCLNRLEDDGEEGLSIREENGDYNENTKKISFVR